MVRRMADAEADAENAAHDTVLTSRRAWLHDGAGVRACRLRLTETCLELAPTALEPPFVVVPLAEVVAVRAVRPLRRLDLDQRPEGTLRFRCFAPAAVVGLVGGAIERAR
jgi:hypothetical protein